MKNYNDDLAILSDKKLLYEFAKETYSDKRAQRNENFTDRSLITLVKSPAIMASRTFTLFLYQEIIMNFVIEKKLLLEKKLAENNSNRIVEEIVAIADELLEYKGISTEQHKILLVKHLN